MGILIYCLILVLYLQQGPILLVAILVLEVLVPETLFLGTELMDVEIHRCLMEGAQFFSFGTPTPILLNLRILKLALSLIRPLT